MARTKGALTATGTMAEVVGKNVDISIDGTFVGTVAVQRNVEGWSTIQTYTAPTEIVVENGAPTPVRLNCTAYTSGTISYAIQS